MSTTPTTSPSPSAVLLGAPSAAEQDLARTLFAAYHDRRQLRVADFAAAVPDLAAAYRVQRELTGLKGEPVAGYKVSLTSAETQHMFGAAEPLYGAQVASRVLPAPAAVRRADLLAPLVEVELNFRAIRPLGADATLDDVYTGTTVAAGLELPDSRFADWFPSLPKELVGSDAAVGGFFVYAPGHPTAEVFAGPDAAAEVHAKLWHDGELVREGASSEVLGNPLRAVLWLAHALDAQGLGGLQAGQRVSSGTFVMPLELTDGLWKASFDSGLGDVEVRVGGEGAE
jgi:2-oxo-hept-3-ene-1,7-dioate hydratase